ncbi:MAG: multidrug efflux SMR transporter [Psychrobacillus sp.]
MAWILLVVAGLTEIIWAIGLKEAHGFTELIPSLVTIIFLVISFFLFAQAMKTIPIGTAYAIFTGIGAAGTAVVGVLWFNEQLNVGKVVFLCLLLFGIVGLKLIDTEEAE